MVAGKHVLIEKPVSANAEEAQLIFDCAKKHNKVAMEAFHWQFHPAAHVVHALVDSGKYGGVLSTYARMTTPTGSIPSSNIRWQFDLAGGSLMDMTYVVSATRYFLDAGASNEVISAKARPMKKDKRVDESIEATLNFRSHGKAVTADIFTDMNLGNIGHIIPHLADTPSIKIELEKATIYYYKYVTATFQTSDQYF
jgi:predicted dehydrogenase